MRADQLRIDDLLEAPSAGGVLRFGGGRTLLYDAVALGLLRAQLVEAFGVTVTQGLLTRLGYSHGYRTAQTMEHALPWDSPREWRIAGGRLHRLQGLVRFEPVSPGQRLDPDAVAEALWRDSYEAEQHILHLGRSLEPVCWSLAGFASGYLSYARGEPIYCVEERCVGRGDAVCHMVGRTADGWGERLAEIRAPFDAQSMDATLEGLRETLSSLETRLLRGRRQVAQNAVERHGVIAKSEAMRRVLSLAERAAKVDASVLICGESGVGKERIARLLHDLSTRCGAPFVAINCGALPPTLLESELFGHVEGAFTGARVARAGLFEAAHMGTLFLDEIGELPLSMQASLLRVLQEGEIRRVGDNASRSVDVRIVSATNRRLPDLVAAREFREDLYYRLQVIEIEVPPLRDRPEDILPLARSLLETASARMNRDVRTLDAAAARQLLAHDWPGNVRELGNVIERAVVFAPDDRIREVELPVAAHASPSPALSDVVRTHILHVLQRARSRAAAARMLGISEATLFRRIQDYRKAGFDV